MSAKLAPPGLLIVTVFLLLVTISAYDLIASISDITNMNFITCIKLFCRRGRVTPIW